MGVGNGSRKGHRCRWSSLVQVGSFGTASRLTSATWLPNRPRTFRRVCLALVANCLPSLGAFRIERVSLSVDARPSRSLASQRTARKRAYRRSQGRLAIPSRFFSCPSLLPFAGGHRRSQALGRTYTVRLDRNGTSASHSFLPPVHSLSLRSYKSGGGREP